jgi:2-oxoisovalerate dehydrogenase E1 component alpha subunit
MDDLIKLRCSKAKSAPERTPRYCNASAQAPNDELWEEDSLRSESVASKRANQELPVIARFEVRHRNYLAPDGSISRPLPAFASDARLFMALYRSMVLLRLFDRKAVALQRTGRLGTYAVSLGQEAVSVGIASAMRGPRAGAAGDAVALFRSAA